MEEARSVNALSKALATLRVAVEFLAVTGGDPEHSLPKYVQQELKMNAGAKQFQDVPVGEGQQVGGKWDLAPSPLLLWAWLCISNGSHLRDTLLPADRPGPCGTPVMWEPTGPTWMLELGSCSADIGGYWWPNISSSRTCWS